MADNKDKNYLCEEFQLEKPKEFSKSTCIEVGQWCCFSMHDAITLLTGLPVFIFLRKSELTWCLSPLRLLWLCPTLLSLRCTIGQHSEFVKLVSKLLWDLIEAAYPFLINVMSEIAIIKELEIYILLSFS